MITELPLLSKAIEQIKDKIAPQYWKLIDKELTTKLLQAAANRVGTNRYTQVRK